ncbi:MAG TPA: SurA N-terminal domain-containing protein, partial [Candidatus Dormibacteraeota bacterium]
PLYTATDLGNGKRLPAVIAQVGTVEISSQQFVRDVTISRYNNTQRGLGMTESQIEQAALAQLIREAALKDRAKKEGIVVTDKQVHAFIEAQASQRAAFFAANPEARIEFEALLAGRHLASAAAYDADPETASSIRDAMLATALVSKHVGVRAGLSVRDAYAQSVVAAAVIHIYMTI